MATASVEECDLAQLKQLLNLLHAKTEAKSEMDAKCPMSVLERNPEETLQTEQVVLSTKPLRRTPSRFSGMETVLNSMSEQTEQQSRSLSTLHQLFIGGVVLCILLLGAIFAMSLAATEFAKETSVEGDMLVNKATGKPVITQSRREDFDSLDFEDLFNTDYILLKSPTSGISKHYVQDFHALDCPWEYSNYTICNNTGHEGVAYLFTTNAGEFGAIATEAGLEFVLVDDNAFLTAVHSTMLSTRKLSRSLGSASDATNDVSIYMTESITYEVLGPAMGFIAGNVRALSGSGSSCSPPYDQWPQAKKDAFDEALEEARKEYEKFEETKAAAVQKAKSMPMLGAYVRY